jgi:hypothetical protein
MAKKKKNKNSWLKNLRAFMTAVIAAIPLVVPAIVAAVASVSNSMELRDGNQSRSNGKNGSSRTASSKRTKKASAKA